MENGKQMLNCQSVSRSREETELLHQWVRAYARNRPSSLWITWPLYLNCKWLTSAIEHHACCQAARFCIANLMTAQEPPVCSELVWRVIFFSRVSALLMIGFPWRTFGPNKVTIWHSLPRTKGFCYSLGGRPALWLSELCCYHASPAHLPQKWRFAMGARWRSGRR